MLLLNRVHGQFRRGGLAGQQFFKLFFERPFAGSYGAASNFRPKKKGLTTDLPRRSYQRRLGGHRLTQMGRKKPET